MCLDGRVQTGQVCPREELAFQLYQPSSRRGENVSSSLVADLDEGDPADTQRIWVPQFRIANEITLIIKN